MSADRVFELARHLTWRDREIALCLYNHQVLSTGQLQLLYFSSRRRCQDRLLFLYRHRMLDRFYPPGPFGAGRLRRRAALRDRAFDTGSPASRMMLQMLAH